VSRLGALRFLTLAGILACTEAERPLAELEELPLGDTSRLPAVLQEAISERRGHLADLIEAGSTERQLAEAWGELGRACHAHGLEEAAEICYQRAAQLAPADLRWSYLQGYLYQTRGQLERAAGAFERVLEVYPGDPPTLYHLGDIELDRNHPQEAEALFRRALESSPRLPAAHYGLGRALLAQGDFEAAIEPLERALAAQPEATRIHHQLGLAYRNSGDLEKAQHHLAQRGDTPVALLDPLIVELQALAAGSDQLVRRGLEAATAGDRKTAEERFRKAVQEDPENVAARYNLAVVLARVGKTEEALRVYREILELDPRNSQVLFNLGNLLAEKGEMASAIGHYRDALDIAPDFKQARFNLAAALSKRGSWAEASAEYEAVFRADPEFASVRFYRAVALERTGRTEEAIEALRDLLQTDPTDAQAALLHSELLLAAKRYHEAATGFGAFVALRPEFAPARVAEAEALRLAGQHAQAGERLEAAARHLPGDTRVALALARHLATNPQAGLRDGEKALALVTSIFEGQPSPGAAETLAMALAEVGRFGEAETIQQRLVSETEARGDPELLRRLSQNLESYRARRPARDQPLLGWGPAVGVWKTRPGSGGREPAGHGRGS
jgi:tetratricopeptide (TPR) repeat protein